MLVLIDESGDPGFKIVRGSSAHFVVSMVIFSDFDCAERCSAAINKVRKDVAISGEFKFNKCTDRVRDAFFVAIKDYDFRIRALVVDKETIYSDNLRRHTDLFYNFFIQKLLSQDGAVLKNAFVKIDGSGSREFRREVAPVV